MLATLRQRDFCLLWSGGLISMVGDWLLLIGLTAYVFQLTGSTLATGVTLIVQLAPGVLLGSVAGVFADRWDRKRILVWANLPQALIILLLLAIRSPNQVWIVYTVGFVRSAIGTFAGPAENSLLPELVGQEHLVSANSLNALNNNLARLIGPALAGLLVASSGLIGVVLLDAASFLIAAAMISLIRTPVRPVHVARGSDLASSVGVWTRTWREWLEGLAVVRGSRLVAGAFVVIGITAFGDAIMTPLWPVFVYESLHRGAAEYGWLSTAQGIGGIVGSLALGRWGNRVGLRYLVALSAGLIGVCELLMFNLPSILLTFALMPICGATVVGAYTGLQVLIQRHVAGEYRGRVFGAYGTTGSLLALTGMGLGGALGDTIPPILLMNASALLYVLSGVVAGTVLRGQPPDTHSVEEGVRHVCVRRKS